VTPKKGVGTKRRWRTKLVYSCRRTSGFMVDRTIVGEVYNEIYSWEWPFLLDLRTIEEGMSNAGLRNRGFDQQDRRLNQIHQGEVGFEQENGD